jgi:hypothetical protein
MLCWGPAFNGLKRFVQSESDEVKAEVLCRVLGGEIAAELATGSVADPERLRYAMDPDEDEDPAVETG